MTARNAWFTPLISNAVRGTLDRYSIVGERARLREMGESQLSDIGISRQDALGEARKPFWQGRR